MSAKRHTINRHTRKKVLARDGYVCHWCKAALTPETYSLDHKTPKQAQGRGSQDNLVVSCKPCNENRSKTSKVRIGEGICFYCKKPGGLYNLVQNDVVVGTCERCDECLNLKAKKAYKRVRPWMSGGW